MGEQSAIDIDAMTVELGGTRVLEDFSLTVRQGEFFTLLGPSGCGKSTILRCIAGFIEPQKGTIRVAGRDVTRLPSRERGVGMVFQNYALFATMDVAQNIGFGLSVAKVGAREQARRVQEIADAVSLSPAQLGKKVSELSGGQQQRVAIARALVLDPTILLLDEPLSNLDAKLRKQLRGQLKDLQEQFGITTLYVTHDQDEALSMSDRIAVLDEGRIAQLGSPEDVYARSADEFVCTFVGDANLLGGRFVERLRADGADLVAGTTRVYVRQENVELLRDPDGVVPPGATVVECTVLATRYHGMYTSVRLQCGDDLLWALRFRAREHVLAEGEVVRVVVHHRDLLAYPA